VTTDLQQQGSPELQTQDSSGETQDSSGILSVPCEKQGCVAFNTISTNSIFFILIILFIIR
jgi:hypothetical protein